MTNHARPQREAQKPSAFLAGLRASNPVRAYEFDRFRIDTKRTLLTRDGEPVAIKAKALDTLVILVQHAGRLLEKEELMNGLWPDTAVEEGTSLRTSSRCGRHWARCRASSGSSRRSPGEAIASSRRSARLATTPQRAMTWRTGIGIPRRRSSGPSASRAGRSSTQVWRRRCAVAPGYGALRCVQALGTGRLRHLVVTPAQPDATDLRRGSADRRELVTRRPADSLRVG